MQYIKKELTPPQDWDKWFTTASNVRSFDYGKDYSSLTNLIEAKRFLIEEQHGLCAYCQQTITEKDASIEHVIPKEFNKELSTCYYNLVAVCDKNQVKDFNTNKLHCDKEKGSKVISPLMFVSNTDVFETKSNYYFVAYADGQIKAKHSLSEEDKKQVEAFIDVLNLNHQNLKDKRAKEHLNALIEASVGIPKQRKNNYWRVQFNSILNNPKRPFRQFLLCYIGNKLGIN